MVAMFLGVPVLIAAYIYWSHLGAEVYMNEDEKVDKTPSMDDKDTPSPPIRTNEEYEADKRAGIERVGKPSDIRKTPQGDK